MDTREIFEKVKVFAETAAKEFDIQKVVLFGSVVRGAFNEYSDIDVAVIVAESDIDILESEFRLYKMRRNIDHRIEPILFVGTVDDSGFLEEILKNGKVVFGAA